MNVLAIFEVITKGLSMASTAIEAGRSAAPAIEALTGLVTKARAGKVTDADLTSTEAALDAQIDEFNEE